MFQTYNYYYKILIHLVSCCFECSAFYNQQKPEQMRM